MGGSAVVMPWVDRPAATLMLWYPGMEGGHALADVLTGVVAPSGRLPFAVPHDEADLVHVDPDAGVVLDVRVDGALVTEDRPVELVVARHAADPGVVVEVGQEDNRG